MRYDHVIRATMATALADAVLAAIYGDGVRLSGSSRLEVPVLEVTLVSDTEGEQWAPVVLQWDQWVASMADLRASERRLRQLFHLEVPAVIGGVAMWAQYVDGDAIGAPNRDGFFGRAVRFQFTPLRERYDQAVP